MPSLRGGGRRAASMRAGPDAAHLHRSVAMLDRMNAERGRTVTWPHHHDLATEVTRQRMRKIVYRVSFVPQIG